MLEYGLLQRAGELLQAYDEFWEATQMANKDVNKNESSDKIEYTILCWNAPKSILRWSNGGVRYSVSRKVEEVYSV